MCDNPVEQLIEYSRNGSKYTRIIKRPCNNCLACRIDKLLLWQSRCQSEYVKTRSSFVTFTFDDNHLIYKDTYSLFPTLDKSLVHKYLDNIKHKVKSFSFLPDKNIKNYHYFSASEYGDLFRRPHTHCLFFGLDYKDMNKLFVDTWKNGYVKSLPILSGGIRYVVDYMTKQLTGEMAIKEYDLNNIERPFTSNSQGIGLDMFLAHREEIADTSFIKFGSRSVPVPTYYINLMRSFSLNNVSEVLKNRAANFRSLQNRISSDGFKDYDTWLKYTCSAKEKELEVNLRRKGVAVNSNYIGKGSQFYDSSLVDLAIN